MTFFLDHDVPDEIAKLLRHWGHSVTLLRKVFPVTATDEEVFNYSREQKALLIACNRDDFLRLAPGQEHAGLIVSDTPPFPTS